MNNTNFKNDSDLNHRNHKKISKNSKLQLAFKKINNSLKNIISSRIFLAILFLLTGAIITNSCNNHKEHKSHYHRHHHGFFTDKFKDQDDDFFEDDFFSEFEAMHRFMEKSMKRHQKIMKQNFEPDANIETKNSSNIRASLNSSEDDKFYNYELIISGLEPEKISVLFEEGYLVFKSQKTDIINTNSNDKTSQSSNSLGFYYATFLPEFDKKITPEIIKTSEKISVKLAKKSQENNVKNPINKNSINNSKKSQKTEKKQQLKSKKSKN